MEVTVTLDLRYSVTPDGAAWSQSGMARSFWERYLQVFDSVRIISRAVPVERPPEGAILVTAKNIRLHAIPDFHGPWEFVRRYPAIRAAIRSALPARGAFIMRVGSQIANCLEPALDQVSHPYALEVVGDPYEVFAPGVVDHPLRPLFRWHFTRHLRRQCLRASGVAYVTRRSLQQRYPTRLMGMSLSDVDLPAEALVAGAGWTHYSNVEIDAAALLERRRAPKQSGPYQLITVGSLAQLYKGVDVLIDAVALCKDAGCDVTAVVAGDGMFRAELTARAVERGVASRVMFAGHVPAGQAVRRLLDESDLFVLPSRTEGLPRALVEAMARSLPCIATNVGGIPELLDDEELVPAGDPASLAGKILEVLRNPRRMVEMSRRNLHTSMEYRDCVLGERRRRFYQHVKDVTSEWEAGKAVRQCEYYR